MWPFISLVVVFFCVWNLLQYDVIKLQAAFVQSQNDNELSYADNAQAKW